VVVPRAAPSRRAAPPLALTPLALLLLGAACGDGGSPTEPPPVSPDVLGPLPVPLSPTDGAQVSSDSPTLVVRNALGYDAGQATYTFEVFTTGRNRTLASLTVPAGRSTTSAALTAPLPRGLSLGWRAVARSAAGEVASAAASFRLPSVVCLSGRSGYAQAVVDVRLPFCASFPNVYNDPGQVLGPPDAGGFGPFNFFGFLSLGDRGHVTVDMEACAVDGPGFDVRVYQAVGSEPVTLFAGGSAGGPFVLLEERKRCGERVAGSQAIRYCDFDLADGEVQEARYFKVEDGELFPCEMAGTPSEGADIDAVQILNARP
jgi:hypothetical protein